MSTPSRDQAPLAHIVTLDCRDAEHAERCLRALGDYGRPNAEHFGCVAYDFGLLEGTDHVVCIVEGWNRWEDLDALLTELVVPALPMYNELLRQPFDPARDTRRVRLRV